MLDYLAVLVVASNHSRFSLDAETTTGTDRCQSTNMRTLRLTFGYRSFDHITRLKPMYPLNGFRTGKCTILFLAPEPIFVGITHLALSTSHRLDLQRLHTIDIQRLWRCFTNTNRIQPMRFGQVTNRSVILDPTTSTDLNRQPGCFKTTPDFPSCGTLPQPRLSMAPWLVSQLRDTRTQRPFDHFSSGCRVDTKLSSTLTLSGLLPNAETVHQCNDRSSMVVTQPVSLSLRG